MSAIISCLVILGTYFLITKIVGKEIIDNSSSRNNSSSSSKNPTISETDEFNFSNDNTLDDATSDTTFNTTSEQNDESIDKFDINDLDNDQTSIMDKLNSVDKNPKVSYPSETDTGNVENTDSVESASIIKKAPIDTSLSDDSFIDFSSPAPSTTTGDTETMAKAVRTMRSKDKEE